GHTVKRPDQDGNVLRLELVRNLVSLDSTSDDQFQLQLVRKLDNSLDVAFSVHVHHDWYLSANHRYKRIELQVHILLWQARVFGSRIFCVGVGLRVIENLLQRFDASVLFATHLGHGPLLLSKRELKASSLSPGQIDVNSQP